MKQITVGHYHKGCWGSGSTEKVHGVKMIQASPNVVKRHKAGKIFGRSFWKVIAPTSAVLEKFLKVLKKEPAVKNYTIVQRKEQRAFILIEYENIISPYEVAVEKGCIPMGSVVIENGIENFTLVAPNERLANELLSILKKDKDVKILSIGKVKPQEMPYTLTEKQREALQIALLYDYYHWPREVTLEELSKLAGTSRKVYQTHLRKAEMKLFPALVKEAIPEL